MGRVQYETDDGPGQAGGSLLGDIGQSIFKSIGNKVVDGITSSGKDLVGNLGDKAKAKLFGSGVASGGKHGAKNHPHSKMGRVQYETDDMDGDGYTVYNAWREGRKGSSKEVKKEYRDFRDTREEHPEEWQRLKARAERFNSGEERKVNRPKMAIPEGLQAYHLFLADLKKTPEYQALGKGQKQDYINTQWAEHKAHHGIETKTRRRKTKGEGLFMP